MAFSFSIIRPRSTKIIIDVLSGGDASKTVETTSGHVEILKRSHQDNFLLFLFDYEEQHNHSSATSQPLWTVQKVMRQTVHVLEVSFFDKYTSV